METVHRLGEQGKLNVFPLTSPAPYSAGGFIVPPNVIPDYYRWIYWWNPFAWAYRALLVNEFQSASYSDGDAILAQMGFLYGKDLDKIFGQEWVMYWFFYMVPHFAFCVLLTALGLTYARSSPSTTSTKSERKIATADKEQQEIARSKKVQIPFKPVTITFEDICYDVKSSTGNDQLRLLNNVNGIFRSGRMAALMGSSGKGIVIACALYISSSLAACLLFVLFPTSFSRRWEGMCQVGTFNNHIWLSQSFPHVDALQCAHVFFFSLSLNLSLLLLQNCFIIL